ncbi:MAG: hypothetical protein J6V87_02055 [Prevotella sp.]|nr:hypothetical protein [Prevotella sp.]
MISNCLVFKEIPRTFMLCFNGECAMRENCLRFQAGIQASRQWDWGTAVFPSALKDGQCPYYRKVEEVQLAYGFHGLYINVPRYERSMMRKMVTDYIGSVGGYYRYHYGERLLTPKQQQTILRFFTSRGYGEGIFFDHYETAYNFEEHE